MIKKSILKISLVAALTIPTISMAATTSDTNTNTAQSTPWYQAMWRPFQSSPQTFIIINEISGAHIGGMDSVEKGCTVLENNGQTIKVTCENSFLSNQADFPLSRDGKNIAFITVSNPSMWSASVDLRDAQSNTVVSSCDGSYTCKLSTSVSNGTMYMLSLTQNGTKTIVIKGSTKLDM
jgi:hypothetical protein